MAFRGVAFQGLAVFLWLLDALLWVALLMSTMHVGMFLRGGMWLLVLLVAFILPIPASALWKAAKKH
jgi:hypothetical protein